MDDREADILCDNVSPSVSHENLAALTQTLPITIPQLLTNNEIPKIPLAHSPPKKKKRRCQVCRKKLGLSGFQCKCHDKWFFCSLHRYSDQHECDFDFMAEKQEQLGKDNPVIISDRIAKI